LARNGQKFRIIELVPSDATWTMRCMDRAVLESMLDEGLSLAEIGQRVGRHEATVSYWLKKHGLAANNRAIHAARGGLDREVLEQLVGRGESIAEIAAAVDRSKATVRHWLAKYGLRTVGRPGPRPNDASLRSAPAGTMEAKQTCPRHGETQYVVDASGYLRCRRCRSERVIRRRHAIKAALVAEAGGRCVLCGYSRCLSALAFHHVEPSGKEFGISHRGVTRSLARARAEAEKCVLLCANCHAEVEAGLATTNGSGEAPIE
jgi:transposase